MRGQDMGVFSEELSSLANALPILVVMCSMGA